MIKLFFSKTIIGVFGLKIKWEGPKVFGEFETFIGCGNVWAKEYTRFGDFIAFLLTSFVKISFLR
jgi:hypothetical protein